MSFIKLFFNTLEVFLISFFPVGIFVGVVILPDPGGPAGGYQIYGGMIRQ